MDYNLTLQNDFQDKLLKLTIQDEGYQQFPYKDSRGILTLGIGFNLASTGLSLEECVAVVKVRFYHIEGELIKCIPVYITLNDARKIILLEMAYQMGIHGICEFKNMIKALNNNAFEEAAKHMLDSSWARVTSPSRAAKYAMIMELGRL